MTYTVKPAVTIFWFRRDLRLDDNAGLYHALKSGSKVLPLFIFDRNFLDRLADRNDPRVSFIHQCITELNNQLKIVKSSLTVKFDTPLNAFRQLLDKFEIQAVFANNDYEPYGLQRDNAIRKLLAEKSIPFKQFKDHVIFEKDEIVKSDRKPYTVYTPYKRCWIETLNHNPSLMRFQTDKYFLNFYNYAPPGIPALEELGFKKSDIPFPTKEYNAVIRNYNKTRDFPFIKGTSRIGIHLRFGTISIRKAVGDALEVPDKTWLSELIWRDFYAMILWHFPHIVNHAFKPNYDKIKWRNNEDEFWAWCDGRTGYPIVDAGMRELNATGFMHNRVRMIVASFLTKHLLIDWRWGEAYFALKLLDYDQASNIGGWQWATGSGNDAAPYFRIFNPELQRQRFDPDMKYIRKWVPEYDDPFKYPQPLVEHTFARERALKVFKEALRS